MAEFLVPHSFLLSKQSHNWGPNTSYSLQIFTYVMFQSFGKLIVLWWPLWRSVWTTYKSGYNGLTENKIEFDRHSLVNILIMSSFIEILWLSLEMKHVYPQGRTKLPLQCEFHILRTKNCTQLRYIFYYFISTVFKISICLFNNIARSVCFSIRVVSVMYTRLNTTRNRFPLTHPP